VNIITIVATRFEIFGVKMYKIRFWLGLCPRPHNRELTALLRWWSLYRSPTLRLHLRGPASKGRGGRGKRANNGEKESRKKTLGPNIHHRSTPLDASNASIIFNSSKIVRNINEYANFVKFVGLLRDVCVHVYACNRNSRVATAQCNRPGTSRKDFPGTVH